MPETSRETESPSPTGNPEAGRVLVTSLRRSPDAQARNLVERSLRRAGFEPVFEIRSLKEFQQDLPTLAGAVFIEARGNPHWGEMDSIVDALVSAMKPLAFLFPVETEWKLLRMDPRVTKDSIDRAQTAGDVLYFETLDDIESRVGSWLEKLEGATAPSTPPPRTRPEPTDPQDPAVAEQSVASEPSLVSDLPESEAPEVKAIAGEEEADEGAALQVARWVLSDKPIDDVDDDLLGFRSYAQALADLINDPKTTTPLVLAINAPWGAGKSSLGRILQSILEGDGGSTRANKTCWFNAWKHDEATGLDMALVAAIGRVTDGDRGWATRVFWERRRLWAGLFVVLLAVLAAFAVRSLGWATAFSGVKPENESLAAVVSAMEDGGAKTLLSRLRFVLESPALAGDAGVTLGGFLVSLLSVVGLVIRFLSTWGSQLFRFITKPQEASTNASMDQVRNQLGDRIRKSTPENGRFVLFIDDLERCRPPRSVDLLEAVNQLLDHENLVIVIMADVPAVAANVEIKYAALASRHNPAPAPLQRSASGRRSYGRLYLQKIVQLQFDLPLQSQEGIRKLLRDLTLKYKRRKHSKATPRGPDPGAKQSSPTSILPRIRNRTRPEPPRNRSPVPSLQLCWPPGVLSGASRPLWPFSSASCSSGASFSTRAGSTSEATPATSWVSLPRRAWVSSCSRSSLGAPSME